MPLTNQPPIIFAGKPVTAFVFYIRVLNMDFCPQKIRFSVVSSCKKIQGENLFFPKWLNVTVLNKCEQKEMEDVYKLYDKQQQTFFYCDETTALPLIEEKMAELIEEQTIRLAYARATSATKKKVTKNPKFLLKNEKNKYNKDRTGYVALVFHFY